MYEVKATHVLCHFKRRFGKFRLHFGATGINKEKRLYELKSNWIWKCFHLIAAVSCVLICWHRKHCLHNSNFPYTLQGEYINKSLNLDEYLKIMVFVTKFSVVNVNSFQGLSFTSKAGQKEEFCGHAE